MPQFRQYPRVTTLEPTDAFVLDRLGVGTEYIEAGNLVPPFSGNVVGTCEVDGKFGNLTICQVTTLGEDFVGPGDSVQVANGDLRVFGGDVDVNDGNVNVGDGNVNVQNDVNASGNLAVGKDGLVNGNLTAVGITNLGAQVNMQGPAECGMGYNVSGILTSQLPTPGNTGIRLRVTDATSPTYRGVLTGSGTVSCWVEDTGAGWVTV